MRNLISYLLLLMIVTAFSCKKKQNTIPDKQTSHLVVVPKDINGQRSFDGWHYITPPSQFSPTDSLWMSNFAVDFKILNDTCVSVNFEVSYGSRVDTFVLSQPENEKTDSLMFFMLQKTPEWGYVGKIYYQKSTRKITSFFHQRFTSQNSKQHDYYILEEK